MPLLDLSFPSWSRNLFLFRHILCILRGLLRCLNRFSSTAFMSKTEPVASQNVPLFGDMDTADVVSEDEVVLEQGRP